MTTGIFRLAVAAVAIGVAASPLNAAFLATTDRGRINSSGFSNNGVNDGYITGQSGSATFRSFFAFNVASLSGNVVSGSFEAFNPRQNGDSGASGYAGDLTETLNLYAVTAATTVSDLNAGTGGNAAYTDLGDGAVYGVTTVSASDNGTFVSVTLNPTGIAALNLARTNNVKFVFGGGVSSISGLADQFIFGSTSGLANDNNTRLNVVLDSPSLVPLPPTLLAGLLGLPLLAGVRRFRRA